MKFDWKKLQKPFTCLAPMDDVTDTVFRQIVAKCARPDIYFSEFVNVEGLCSNGRKRLLPKLKYDQSEHPIVAQVWGKNPDNYFRVVQEIAGMGIDGIDINMGCPVKDVVRHGGGAAMIDKPELVGGIVSAVKAGIREAKKQIPVSVKTRIGIKSIKTEEWIGFLLSQNLDALTVHGRTAVELSKVPAHWDEIGKVVKLRDQLGLKTVIIGNGDVRNYTEATGKAKIYGVDGVMIGRGIFNDMFAFAKKSFVPEVGPQIQNAFMLDLMRRHIDLFIKTWGNTKNFIILRKFFKIYVSGFENASKIRTKLMSATTAEEALEIINGISGI